MVVIMPQLMSQGIYEKLPPLWRMDMRVQHRPSSYSAHSHLSMSENREQNMGTAEDWNEDYFSQKPVQRTYNSATGRRRMNTEEQDFLKQKPELVNIFPPKPVCHKSTNQRKCQADGDYFEQKEQRRRDFHFSEGKQVINRRQQMDKSVNGYQKLHEDQRRLYEHQNRMAKKIQEKEKTLQEKLLKAEEKLRKIQLRTTSGDKVRREERMKDVVRMDKNLYCTENAIRDYENTRERTTGNKRNEAQIEKTRDRDWESSNKYIGRWEKCETGMKEGWRERERDEIEWENWERHTERIAGSQVEKHEWDYYEELTKLKREGARNEQVTKRERTMQWNRSEIMKQERKDLQETMNTESSGRRRIRRDIEKNKEKWDIMKRFESNAHAKGFTKNDKIKGFMGDQWEPQERDNNSQNGPRAADEMNSNTTKALPRELLTKESSHSPHLSQSGKMLQQTELCNESLDVDVQYMPCNICHRRFAVDRLKTHSKICKKTVISQRKTFDSSKQRAKGTSLEEFMRTNKRSKTPELKNNWRQKHEAFILNMRQARAPVVGGFQHMSNVDQNPDYVSCPHCSRRFAPGPAERHIPKCQSIKSKPPPPKHRR